MRHVLFVTLLSVAAIFLGSASLVSAAAVLGDETPAVATAPSSHREDDNGGRHGPPDDRGRPDGVGRGQGQGQGRGLSRSGPPELPAQASPRAHEAVQLAFERQLAIRDRVEQIRAIPPGPGKGAAVSELMKQFGQLYRLTDGAVEAD